MNSAERMLLVSFLLMHLQTARAQEHYTRKNTLSAFAEYSNDSSHIFLGTAPNRKIAGLGLQ